MLLNIDVEGLKSEKLSLEKRLGEVTAMLMLVEQGAKYQAPQVQQVARPVVEAHQTQYVRPVRPNKSGRTMLQVGMRKQITELLASGPATEYELSKVLGIKQSDLHVNVQPMITNRLVFVNEFGKLQLSEEGQKRAQWFKEHPQFKTFRPDIAASINNLPQFKNHQPMGPKQ